LKVGDVIVVEGFRARDGTNNASGGTVTFPDGRRVLTAGRQLRSPSMPPTIAGRWRIIRQLLVESIDLIDTRLVGSK
jgi:hypothetical protein